MDKPEKGLRLRKKEKTYRAILNSAYDLITTKGLDGTTMEDIARSAEISVPTIYSYFKSKEDIIFALFEMDDKYISKKIADIIDNMPENVVEAVTRVQISIVSDGFDITKKEVWREISSAALRGPQERRLRYLEIQEKRVEILGGILKHFQDLGQLDLEGSQTVVAGNLYAISRNAFRKYLMSDSMTTDALNEEIRTGIRVALAGYRLSS